MNKTEQSVIREVVARLECAPRADCSERAADYVTAALRGPARLYLETWVIPPLQMLLPESRNIELAGRMARPDGRPTPEAPTSTDARDMLRELVALTCRPPGDAGAVYERAADMVRGEAGEPSYAELLQALRGLERESWLDADPAENEHVGAAKRAARDVLAKARA